MCKYSENKTEIPNCLLKENCRTDFGIVLILGKQIGETATPFLFSEALAVGDAMQTEFLHFVNTSRPWESYLQTGRNIIMPF